LLGRGYGGQEKSLKYISSASSGMPKILELPNERETVVGEWFNKLPCNYSGGGISASDNVNGEIRYSKLIHGQLNTEGIESYFGVDRMWHLGEFDPGMDDYDVVATGHFLRVDLDVRDKGILKTGDDKTSRTVDRVYLRANFPAYNDPMDIIRTLKAFREMEKNLLEFVDPADSTYKSEFTKCYTEFLTKSMYLGKDKMERTLKFGQHHMTLTFTKDQNNTGISFSYKDPAISLIVSPHIATYNTKRLPKILEYHIDWLDEQIEYLEEEYDLDGK